MARLLEAHFPEVMKTVILAPIPSKIKALVQSMLWMLPEKTRKRFALVSSGAEVCEVLGMKLEDFPEHFQDLEGYELERRSVGVVLSTMTEDGHEHVMRSIDLSAG